MTKKQKKDSPSKDEILRESYDKSLERRLKLFSYYIKLCQEDGITNYMDVLNDSLWFFARGNAPIRIVDVEEADRILEDILKPYYAELIKQMAKYYVESLPPEIIEKAIEMTRKRD